MPYADPERRLEAAREWRKRVMPKGYGKWLYARRKLRFDDAERFRQALEWIVAMNPDDSHDATPALRMQEIAQIVLNESREAEEALGPWEGGGDDQAGS